VYEVKMRGLLAWFLHRTYHLSRVPTLNRKVRVVADWTLALFFRREVVSPGEPHRLREEFAQASGPPPVHHATSGADGRTRARLGARCGAS
jgi:NADH dehydrogenase